MKTSVLTSFFTVIIVLMNNCTYSQNNSSDKQITKMLKEFYSNYITENSKMPPNIKKIAIIKNIYCSKKLVANLNKKQLDYDPFLNAQDSDVDWIKTLTISKGVQNKNLYVVTYSIDGSKNTVKLMVVNEVGKFKIDSILKNQ